MSSPDRLASLWGPFRLVWPSLLMHYEVLKEAMRKDGLAAFTHLQAIRDAATAKLFSMASDGFIAFENTTNVPSLVRSAHGKILELGPGPGNQIHRYDHSLVDFIYATEPNPHYADDIAAKIKKVDLQDKYKLLACSVEDSEILSREGITEGSIDTVLSIQVLCAVDDVQSAMKQIYKLLKPGGSFVFWEHVRSKDTITSIAQTCWNPTWSALVGCCLNRDIMKEILAAGEWVDTGKIVVAEDPYTCLPRIEGVLTKKIDEK